MENHEESLSPQQSLQLITDTLMNVREDLKENSFPFLLWGWLIAIASFLFFGLQHYTHSPYYFLPFPLLAVVGVITTFGFYSRRISNSTLSHLSTFLHKMWLVLGLSFFVVVFITVTQGQTPFTYTLVIAGVGTLASGLIMKFKPLIIGGIIFFGAALVSVYIAEDYKVLLHGVAILSGYIIPGYLLKASSK